MSDTVILLIVVAAILTAAGALYVILGPLAARKSLKLRPLIEHDLDLLIWVVNEWKGNRSDLVPGGIWDVSTKRPDLLMVIVPSSHEVWTILRHPTKGHRLVVGLVGQESRTIYPYHGWSREPWLKAKLDHLREALAKLPPPPSPEEEEEARQAAMMAEIERFDVEADALVAELGPAYAVPRRPEGD